MRKIGVTIIFLIFILSMGMAKDKSIGVFVSLNEEHAFWKSVRSFMEAVASDLKINLRWDYADNNQIKASNDIEKETSGANPIDAALIVNFKQQGESFFTALDKKKMPTIIHVVGADHNVSGKPREKHKSWIAEIVVDEEKVGYELAKRLINDAEKKGLKSSDGKIHIIAISGLVSDLLSQQRETGMLKAINEKSNLVKFEQIVSTVDWSTREGHDKFIHVIERYPSISVVWCANDDIALGVVKGIREIGKLPGKDIVTGGIDWVPEALQLVKKGEMVCSIGGLSWHGGWATILFYDYLNGKDFINDTTVTVETQPEVLSQENVDTFLKVFGDGNWEKVDFKKFSKTLNPKLKKYDFSLKNLMNSL
ncbi:MAG: hypothetical protein A2Y34_01170 [Spirochaetes bacterium GWC1_27_15]|nr:MAG: hypothetical protein A2Z98_00970 [Spirochaetes bacterium GWB1_27_13]OHD24059.1 MAG: hypothetical protein A2Y34_01170 [Spirochaetes bacterium GWC1_27_15]